MGSEGDMLYFLMHENDKLALFNYEKPSINEIVINEKNIDKLPLAETDKASLKASLMDWLRNCRKITAAIASGKSPEIQ
nr:hypothetical protein [uncultured Acetatifactor sp.]